MAGQIPTKGVQPKSRTPRNTPAKKATAKAPGKAIAKVPRDEPLTLAQAESLTAAIKQADENLATKIIASFTGRIWEAYGLKDWAEYATQQLAEAQISRELRKALVPQLAKARISNRAIAAGLGADEKTIRNDLAQATKAEDEVRENSAPQQEPPLDVDEVPATEVTNGHDEHAGERLGADGKWYPDTKPQREPKQPDVVTEARKLATKFDNLLQAADDFYDEFPGAATHEEVRTVLTQTVSYVLDFAKARYLLPEPEPAV